MDRTQPGFDVFMSHNGEDKPCVIELATRLKERGIRVWLDAWELRPGLSWQEGLSVGLSNSSSCAVLFGPSGYGGWHKREMEAALTKQGLEFPVIPVLLPGAPERASIGAFLLLLTWVDFRKGLDDMQAMHRLIWGITGLRPANAAVSIRRFQGYGTIRSRSSCPVDRFQLQDRPARDFQRRFRSRL